MTSSRIDSFEENLKESIVDLEALPYVKGVKRKGDTLSITLQTTRGIGAGNRHRQDWVFKVGRDLIHSREEAQFIPEHVCQYIEMCTKTHSNMQLCFLGSKRELLYSAVKLGRYYDVVEFLFSSSWLALYIEKEIENDFHS